MNLFIRLFLHYITSRFRTPCGMLGPCFTPFRVWPSDLDVLGHMNNGIYFSILDIGRVDLMIRSGLWARLKANGYYPVVAAETMRFRRSLMLFQRFYVKTQVIGWDDKAFLLEQKFLLSGKRRDREEVVAEALIRARFLRKSGGAVPPSRILELADIAHQPPPLDPWIEQWNSAQAGVKNTG